jgi:hypothetical protein
MRALIYTCWLSAKGGHTRAPSTEKVFGGGGCVFLRLAATTSINVSFPETYVCYSLRLRLPE